MMSAQSVSRVSPSSSFLTGLEETATREIMSAAQVRKVPAKQNIITGGGDATHLFALRKGRVHFYHLTKQGETVLLGWLTPGDVIGLVAMLKAPGPYMATADATSDCELLVWDHRIIRKLASQYPLLLENGLRIALDYLRNYIERHVGLTTKTAEERLATALLTLGDRSGEVNVKGIDIHATNEQIGGLADISPFTTSRVLSKWARAGIISKSRGQIRIHDPEALMID